MMSRAKTAPITPPAQPGKPPPPLWSCVEELVLELPLVLLYGQYVSMVLLYFLSKIPARELLVHDVGAVVLAPPSELISCQL